jgi:hypothetical protein
VQAQREALIADMKQEAANGRPAPAPLVIEAIDSLINISFRPVSSLVTKGIPIFQISTIQGEEIQLQ